MKKFTSSLVSELTDGNYSGMLKWAISIALVAVGSALARLIGTNLIVKVNSAVCNRFELDLCDKALKIKSRYLGEFKSGELTAITKNDPKTIVGNLRKILTQFLGIMSSIAIAFYVLCFLNVYCGILYIVFFGLVLLTQNNSLKKEGETEEDKKKNEDNATSLIN